ncbi:MAG: peptidase M22 [Clostridia bacterium]|nr:peptidase M22 [Clostridia bacterium]
MDELCFIGFDTSNYTTSVAVVDGEDRVIANLKQPLAVQDGEHGLRQSDAVFQHVKNLPLLAERLAPVLAGRTPLAVGVSEKPRDRDGSYMPCFLAGIAAASNAAAVAGLPLYRFSHQSGHLMAAIVSSRRFDLLDRPFYAYHVSGGTTELLAVSRTENGFDSEIVGGTRDLNAGQAIDRIGVALGVPFPAGPGLEKLALSYTGKIPRKKPAVKDGYVNLSGLENLALDLYRKTDDPALVAAFVFAHLSDAILQMTDEVTAKYGARDLLCAGGVMSSVILRRAISERYPASFAEPALSADNAVGIAALAARAYRRQNGEGG